MFWISFLVTALLVIGVVLVLKIDKNSLNEFFNTTKSMTVERIRKPKKQKQISLKKRVDLIINGKKSNFIIRTFQETEVILSEMHQKHRLLGVYILSGVCCLFGLLVAWIMQNMFVAPPLAIGAALVPTWIVKLNASRGKKKLVSELEVALSGITTSYLRSDNIISAVEENLVYLEKPIKTVFSKFVNENKLINSNVGLGIQKMRHSLNNEIFQEWCDALYQCQSDRTLKSTLFPVVNKFSETKSIQAELDTLMIAPFKDTISIAVIVMLSIPLMQLVNPEWFNILVNTIPGQVILGLTFSVLVFAINKSVSLTSPIRRDETIE